MNEKMYIGRTNAYYEPVEESLYIEDTWTWSEDPIDKDFAGEVYELNEEGISELNWWLRCRRMNAYERAHSWNPDTRGIEQVWDSLIKNGTLI